MNGCVYVVGGDKFSALTSMESELHRSITTLCQVEPDLPIVVWSDGIVVQDEKAIVLQLDKLWNYPFLNFNIFCGMQIQAVCRSPFDKTLMLDADTAILQPISSIFDMEGDLIICREALNPTIYNAGVYCVSSQLGYEFTRHWWDTWLNREGAVCDQDILIESIDSFHTKLKIVELDPLVWNVRPKDADNMTSLEVRNRVRILHSRWHELDSETVWRGLNI